MITTISKQGGRRYPQMGSTGLPYAGWMPCSGGVATAVTSSTGGWLGRSYEEWEKLQRGPLPVSTVEPSADRLTEYQEKSQKITQAIARLRDETATIEAESQALREKIAALNAKRQSKQIAARARELLLKEQAITLARAQEAALLEQLEAIDVAYVSVVALMAVIQ